MNWIVDSPGGMAGLYPGINADGVCRSPFQACAANKACLSLKVGSALF